jgi:hypothetical protein
MEVRRWRKQCEERANERKSLRRLKSTVGCNASKRRRNVSATVQNIFQEIQILKDI